MGYIPADTLAKIFALEALVEEAFKDLSLAIRRANSTDDPYAWKEVNRLRTLLVERNRLYTLTILGLQRSQERA